MIRRAAPVSAPLSAVLLPALLLAALLLLGAACGSSGSVAGGAANTTSVPPSPPSTLAPVPIPPSPIPTADQSAPGTFGKEPTVKVPTGPPPPGLETADLINGTGPAAKPGDQVSVQYVGVSYTTKQVFDASWNRGQAFPFALGAGQVIKGWDQGVAGMKVGGRRELIIPPSLAYGSRSPGAGIVANDTLIFIVDLVHIG